MNSQFFIKTFLDLIEIKSPSGEEEKISNYLYNHLKERGLDVESDKAGNVTVYLKGKGDPLLLCSHMDTVESGEQIRPVVKGNKIQSLGNTILGADDKLGIAAILTLIEYINEDKSFQHRPIYAVFTVSEETDGKGAQNLDYKKINAKEGYTLDGPGRIGTIVTASPNYLSFDIKILGKASHSSKPEKGINALTIFLEVMKKVELGRVSPKTLINLGHVNVGEVRNAVPGKIEIQGEIRSYSFKEMILYKSKIKHEFARATKKRKGKITFSASLENKGYKISSNNTFLARTKRLMEKARMHPVLAESLGVSDANIISEHGIEVLDLGLGINNPHTTEEYVYVSDLEKILKLLKVLVSA